MDNSTSVFDASSPVEHCVAPVPAPNQVQRLMYASQSCLSGSVFEAMQGIRSHALRRNAADRVHVALLHQSGWFMEWIEGPAQGVQALMSRVANDPRHQNLHLLHQSNGPRRLTEPWSMAHVQTHEAPNDFMGRVMALCEDHRQGKTLEPAAIWRRLSTPLTHPKAFEQGPDDGFQRVMVCSAQGAQAFNLVHWLGQTRSADVVHRRFIGSRVDIQDVATDYVDLNAGTVVRRVVAMARNGLEIGLTRAFLTEYSRVILLLSGLEPKDQSVLERLLAACAHLRHRPILVGLGPLECDHAALQRQAHAGGLVYLDCDLAGDMGPESLWAAAEPALDLAVAANYSWLSQQAPDWNPALRANRPRASQPSGVGAPGG